LRPHAVDPFEVGAGLEMLAVAPEHDDPQARFPAEIVHGREHAGDQLAIIGVVDLRPVQRDGRDAARVEAPQDRVGSHRRILRSFVWRALWPRPRALIHIFVA